eukprot:CAMPEP_0168333324 /NCGR_PEP_ID=MMETSP0213-20121227/9543_1 /TAXON_ID=151035 /ORGANISM="Euplotes harpa, Strain FSP1.4" /LENGTH=274 /DNA_ID=CAMNT_0008337633 /DNA_START=441 /DNA_END=1265 /DNA_ORIENTATION=-
MKDVILNSKSEILREFLKTINALKYSQLKAYIKQINSAEFATVVNYLKNFPSEDELDAKLIYAKDAIKQIDELLENELEQLNRENSAEIREKTSKKFCDHLNLSLFQKDGILVDSLISSLLLFKRSELDRVVSKISKYQSKLRRKSKRRVSMKIVSELSKKSIPKYELTRITKKTVKKVSDSKLTVSSFHKKREQEVKLLGDDLLRVEQRPRSKHSISTVCSLLEPIVEQAPQERNRRKSAFKITVFDFTDLVASEHTVDSVSQCESEDQAAYF